MPLCPKSLHDPVAGTRRRVVAQGAANDSIRRRTVGIGKFERNPEIHLRCHLAVQGLSPVITIRSFPAESRDFHPRGVR